MSVSPTAVRYAPNVGPLLTYDEAQRLILERVRPLSAETVPLAKAAGRVTAGAARAAVDLPPFPSSAMDGYAVRSQDVPGTLPVVAEVAAGRPPPRPPQGARAEPMASSPSSMLSNMTTQSRWRRLFAPARTCVRVVATRLRAMSSWRAA